MSDGFTPELARYADLRSTWVNADDAFRWLVGEVKKNSNGEPTESYAMSMAARDLIIDTLVNVYSYDTEDAIAFVAGTGAMQLEIQQCEDQMREQLVIGWQPDSQETAEVFVFALDSAAVVSQDD